MRLGHYITYVGYLALNIVDRPGELLVCPELGAEAAGEVALNGGQGGALVQEAQHRHRCIRHNQ